MSELYSDVQSMLRAHSISGAESPIDTNGYSGARFSVIDQGGTRHVLKRMRLGDDWIMRHTVDVHFRESQFAVSPFVERLPDGARVPTLGASYDGDGRALLMRDLAETLFPDEGIMAAETMDVVLQRIAGLHAAFWGDALTGSGIDWCGDRERATLLSPAVGAMLIDGARDFGLAQGWRTFDRVAPPEAVTLMSRLFDDPSPLLVLLDSLPRTLIHGDLKLANLAVDGGGVLWLLDWALVSRGPVAVDLAWFVAVNSSRLPWPLDETVARYEGHLRSALGLRFDEAQWSAQVYAVAISGLLLYGWGKALDAEAGRPEELHWWCERAMAAAAALGW